MNRRIEDNTVRYCLYPKLDEDQVLYRTYIDNCLAKLAIYLTDYFWYYTSFNLNYISKETSHSKVAHIEGCTNFEENIEDEWFIVYLLYELSKEDPDLIVQIEDSDGYFLLIEAADHLPKWVNPKTSLNRCFIYRGQLHLIPVEQAKSQSSNQSSKQNSSLSIHQALNLIRDPKLRTVCSNAVQEQIQSRIQDYPAKINNQLLHKCKVTLPSSIAYLLNEDPTLICHSVRAFYNRDALDLAACRLMKNFQPKQLVTRIVKLSKFNYAELLGQNYKPDLKLNWYSSIRNVMPTNSALNSSTNTASNRTTATINSLPTETVQKQYDLGFKISCGFEILVSTYKSSNEKRANNDDEKFSRQTTNWKAFLSNLKRRNYFDNLIEQSNEYEARLAKAKLYFTNSELSEVTSDSALIKHNQIGRRICDLLSKFNEIESYEQFKKEELNLSNEDSDNWLNELPDFLLKSEKESFDDLPNKITNSLQEFIKVDSDYKGIELDDNPKKRKSDLKERAFKMMSDNLRSIITMKVSDSESDHTETDLSDYNYSSASSDEELNVNELKYMKQQSRSNKNKKFKDRLNERKKRTKIESNSSIEDNEIKQLMNEMDKELSTTTIGESFEKLNLQKKNIVPMANCAEFDEDYSTEDENGLNDVDVEYNTVKNLLGSFNEQNGLAGPTSNLLQSLGVRLPKDLD